MNFIDKDLVSIQESRILMEEAKEAKNSLAVFPQSKLDEVLECMYQAISPRITEIACLSVEETGYGCREDESAQLKLLLEYLMKKLKDMLCVGILKDDREEKTMDVGIPLGIVTVFLPSVNPVPAVISSAFLCVKTGNAVVFSPSVRAQKTVRKTVDILAKAAALAGIPQGSISCLKTVANEGSKAMLTHPDVSIVLNIGRKDIMSSALLGKPVIYGGTGPSPVFIERTADIERAVKDIMMSRSFNCGILPASEQYVVADSLIATQVKQEMKNNGAYFLNEQEEERLIGFLCPGNHEMDVEYIGKPAAWLAKKAGFYVPETTSVLVSEKGYIPDCNPYAKELRCPILAFYIEQDWMYACERCMNLLVHESRGHSLVIHSKDEEVIRQFILKKPVARVLVNTPAAFGAMGLCTNLFPAAALGGLTAGMGITADNLSPMHLIYIRKAGYGVRTGEELLQIQENSINRPRHNSMEEEPKKVLEQILLKLLNEIQ